MHRTILTLASGRSGTRFLSEVLRRNAANAVCRHETYGWNPSLFGRPIYDHAVGNDAAVRRLVARKAWIADRQGGECYVETSHALLKSYYLLATEFFPALKLIHLVRDPRKVAKSEAHREALLHRYHVPFRNYRGGDGKAYFRWALTGLEPIFRAVGDERLTRFQWYVIQWVEIENRAQTFLNRFKKRADCFVVHGPHDLNDAVRMQELLTFLELEPRQATIRIAGSKNETPGWKSQIQAADEREFDDVIARLPAGCLEIFRQPPYTQWAWAERLRK